MASRADASAPVRVFRNLRGSQTPIRVGDLVGAGEDITVRDRDLSG